MIAGRINGQPFRAEWKEGKLHLTTTAAPGEGPNKAFELFRDYEVYDPYEGTRSADIQASAQDAWLILNALRSNGTIALDFTEAKVNYQPEDKR